MVLPALPRFALAASMVCMAAPGKVCPDASGGREACPGIAAGGWAAAKTGTAVRHAIRATRDNVGNGSGIIEARSQKPTSDSSSLTFTSNTESRLVMVMRL